MPFGILWTYMGWCFYLQVAGTSKNYMLQLNIFLLQVMGSLKPSIKLPLPPQPPQPWLSPTPWLTPLLPWLTPSPLCPLPSHTLALPLDSPLNLAPCLDPFPLACLLTPWPLSSPPLPPLPLGLPTHSMASPLAPGLPPLSLFAPYLDPPLVLLL